MSLMDRLSPEQMAGVVLRLHDALERSAVPAQGEWLSHSEW